MSRLAHRLAALAEALANVRWAFNICRTTSPRLYAALWVNALIGTIFPAGLALAVRGLVNIVSDGLAGTASFRPEGIYLWLALGFAMTLGTVANLSVNRFLGRRLETRLHYRLNLDILVHCQAMEFARFEDTRFFDSLKRAQQTPETHVTQSLACSLDLLTKTIQGLSLAVILLVIEPLLFLLLLPFSVPYLLFQWRLSARQFREVDARIQKQRRIGYYSSILGSEEQAAEIKLLGLGPLFIDRCRTLMAEFQRLLLDFQRFEFLGNLTFVAVSVAIVYLTMTRVSFDILDGGLRIGDLVIFGSAAAQLRVLVETCIGLVSGLRWQALHVGNVRAFLSLPTGPPRSGKRQETLAGRIEFRAVVFTYPGGKNPTLADLSFTIQPGENVALVGMNGAGKTTIAKLIARLHDPDSGSVLFDGVDGRELDGDHLRRQIACVFQNFGRYSLSVAENIALGDWQRLLHDRQAVEEAARAAGVLDMIQAMPRGFDTELGRSFDGHQPSGGQWQHLAIARAVARDARILILDEPTASLDVDTEYGLFLRFRELARGRTTLLISHRFSTVRMADRIMVLDGGRIVESGSHDDLMLLDGRYAAAFRLHHRHLVEP